jgi:TolB protein
VETSQYDTYVADIDGSQRALVIEGMHQPAFSPEGQWLSVNGERPDHLNLFIVRPDGSELREITEHVEDGFPSWSPTLPTGNKDFSLAFSSTRHGDKQPRIYVVDRMPLDGQKVDARLLSSGLDDVRGEFPTWAWYADQMHLVYAGCQYDEGGSAECGLMRIPSRPGSFTPRPLTTHPGDTAPAAHGSRIAFMSNRDGNWEIYLVESDGSGLKRLTHGLSNDGLPTWSPDGQAIAFLSDEGGAWAVWAVKPDGSQRQRLLAVGDLGPEAEWQRQRISWGPGSP